MTAAQQLAATKAGKFPPDFTDARYWLIRQQVLGGGETDAAVLTSNPTDVDLGLADSLYVVATNLGEAFAGTHKLATDCTIAVEVFAVYDVGNPQNKNDTSSMPFRKYQSPSARASTSPTPVAYTSEPRRTPRSSRTARLVDNRLRPPFTDGQPCIVVNSIEVNYTQPSPTAGSPTHLLPLTIDGEDQYYLGEIVGTDTSEGNPWSGCRSSRLRCRSKST